MNDEKHIAKLPEDILYLLRLKAMTENIIQKKRTACSHDSLVSYLVPDKEDEKVREPEGYFKELSDVIGTKGGDKTKKRQSISLNSAWDIVRYQMQNHCSYRFNNVRCVKVGNEILKRDDAREAMAEIFDFDSYEEFRTAALNKKFKFPKTDRVFTVDDKNLVAQTLGYSNWMRVHGEEDAAFKVSVTTLKRLYGRCVSTKPVSSEKLDYIADFICGQTWDELQENKIMVREDLEAECISFGSRIFRPHRPQHDGNVWDIYSSRLQKGDMLYIQYVDGRRLQLEYEGDFTYRVVATESHILKVDYRLVVMEIHRSNSINVNQWYDEHGKALDDEYISEVVEDITFKGVTP